jgi:predicted nucleotidyltransferase
MTEMNRLEGLDPLGHAPKLAEIVRRLVEAYRPERIYLFGSKARGDEGPDSDYDLLLVVPDDAEPERKKSKLAYQVLWGVGTAADVIVWTRTAFDRRSRVPASLPATVLGEGEAPPCRLTPSSWRKLGRGSSPPCSTWCSAIRPASGRT